jgi:hypothetical protein
VRLKSKLVTAVRKKRRQLFRRQQKTIRVTAVQDEASFANKNQYGGSRTRKNKRATVERLENKYDDSSARKKNGSW